MNKDKKIKIAEEIKVKHSKAKKLLIAGAVLAGTSSFAGILTDGTTTDSFGDILNTFETWITGSLGKLLALIGFIATFLIYLMTHKGNVLFIGIIISLIAGGIPGIVETFFDMGTTTFTPHTATAP